MAPARDRLATFVTPHPLIGLTNQLMPPDFVAQLFRATRRYINRDRAQNIRVKINR
jgi:hypothetical protein